MPTLTRWFLKAAILYLLFALVAGIALAFPSTSPISGFFPAYFHMLTFGWLTQLIFGVAFWMFPKYSPPILADSNGWDGQRLSYSPNKLDPADHLCRSMPPRHPYSVVGR
ncbi:MAG: hypothetical protein U0V48_14315 [Anaerolineales bacterium]